MTLPSSNIQPDDYISFSGLRSFLTGLFRFSFRCCRLAADAIRNHLWLIITGTVLGASLGGLYYTVSGQKYKVTMLVQYRTLDRIIYRNIVSDLNQMIVYGSRGRIAAQLGVPLRVIENVNKLGTADVNGKPLSDETNLNFPIFEITAELRSPQGVDTLGNALIGYINNLPYLYGEIAEQMKIREDRLSFIQKQLTKIDSLNLNRLSDPASIYRQSYSLDSLRAAIRGYLIHGDRAISEITGFRAADKPQSAPTAFGIIVLAIGGFGIAFLFALFLELKLWIQ